MEFRTELKLPVSPIRINHESHLFFIGSCFSSNIGIRLLKDKFNCVINPFGTLYNPTSICKLLNSTIDRKKINIDDIIEIDSSYYHLDYHSSINAPSSDNIIDYINNLRTKTLASIRTASHIFITLGSAFAFKFKKTNKIIGNCHKLPASYFNRILLSPAEITDQLITTCGRIHYLNPNCNIILTVSPIRHIRDGLINNSRSKSILVQCCHEVLDQLSFVQYFPSYEIMYDDLRDYRFYESDLIHPNSISIEYIYEKFSSHFFNAQTNSSLILIRNIVRAAEHKAFNVKSEKHQVFLKTQLSKLEDLSKTNKLDFTKEKSLLQSQLLG